MSDENVNDIKITEHFSVGIRKGRVYTIIDGRPVYICRHAILTIPVVDDPENDDSWKVDNMDELLERYTDKKLTEKLKIPIETQLFVHASNIQAWVDSGYDISLIHSRIGIAILNRLYRVDQRAFDAYVKCIHHRWEEGTYDNRNYLINVIDPEIFAILHKNKYIDIFDVPACFIYSNVELIIALLEYNIIDEDVYDVYRLPDLSCAVTNGADTLSSR